MNLFITGGSSGVGQACVELFNQYHVTAPTRDELDLSNFEAIDQLDLSPYDIVINCAGANAGAFKGWLDNSWQNQQKQVDVNFTGALLLAKQYVQQRPDGHFIYVTSSNIDDPIVYNIFYTAGTIDEYADLASQLTGEFHKTGRQFVGAELCNGYPPAVETLQ